MKENEPPALSIAVTARLLPLKLADAYFAVQSMPSICAVNIGAVIVSGATLLELLLQAVVKNKTDKASMWRM